MDTKIDCWIVSDYNGVKLFIGAKPEKLNGVWSTQHGPSGLLPQKTFPPREFVEPRAATIHIRK
jgi:hypothetical protein